MSELNWDDIVEIPAEDAEQEMLESLEDTGFNATSWQEGDPSPMTVRAVSIQVEKLSKYGVFLRDQAHNGTASGKALTKLSLSRFENTRNEATTAQREIELSCSASAGPHTGIAVGDIVLEDEDGLSVRNIEGLSVVYPVTIPSGGSVTLLFEAESPGTDANLGPDSYTSLVTTLAGVTVTSDTPSRDGTDEESDARLQARNSSTIATKSLEPIAIGIENLAFEAAPTVAQVGIDDLNPRGPGTFDVYLAADLGASPTEDVDAVQEALDGKVMGDVSGAASTRPGYAQPAPEVELDIIGTVYYASTADGAAVQTAVELAITAFLKTIPLGGFDYSDDLFDTVPKNEIENAIRATIVSGASGLIATVVLTTPSADVSVGGFSKVTLGDLTLTYTAVS